MRRWVSKTARGAQICIEMFSSDCTSTRARNRRTWTRAAECHLNYWLPMLSEQARRTHLKPFKFWNFDNAHKIPIIVLATSLLSSSKQSSISSSSCSCRRFSYSALHRGSGCLSNCARILLEALQKMHSKSITDPALRSFCGNSMKVWILYKF
jgi:hypothetical protein